MDFERVTEIFVILENKPSVLGELLSELAENEINVEAIGVFQDTAKIFVKNVSKAVKVMNKLNYTTEIRDVLLIHLENKPGALAEVATRIGDEGINIEYCYGTLSQSGDKVSVIMDVSNVEEAIKVLQS
ncbi:MAG: ACT domain-containing protein [Acidobacteriota bacterium]|nr:ACT domain-containing protein [Acidobacteriota bacterium]MDW3228715.1 ACT domain-containing protein [Acidobacteriota bacterium]MDY0231781.1 ACT domain-containing protein [Candidatus Saccharicenans sp.]